MRKKIAITALITAIVLLFPFVFPAFLAGMILDAVDEAMTDRERKQK